VLLEAQARKSRSIAVLQAEAVPYIDHLPAIETETESHRRTAKEVALRAMALCFVAVKGEGLDQSIIDYLVTQYAIADSFTPKERHFIRDPFPTQQDRIQFCWRYESYWVLLWALNFIKVLRRPDHLCDVPRSVSILRDLGRDGCLASARLRPQADILDAADLIYRYDWAVVEARIKGQVAPAGLDAGVVLERHYALNWLIGYRDQAWYDISTDT